MLINRHTDRLANAGKRGVMNCFGKGLHSECFLVQPLFHDVMSFLIVH